MAINSKKKGSKNERDVARLFKEWTGYDFARVPQSGGLNWHTSNSTGDIICTDEKHAHKFKFTVECKFHEEINFAHLIDGTISKKTNKVIHFWEQAVKEGKTVNKVPLLFMRKNGMKRDMHFVAMPERFFSQLYWTFTEFGYITFISDQDDIAIVNSVDFFNTDYKAIRKKAKKYVATT